MEHVTTALLEWGVASHFLESEVSGDAYMVRETQGAALLAVVDGLGHGPAAAAASRLALDLLASTTVEDLDRSLARCHERLRSTRGVVLALACLDGAYGRLTWVSVGNVQGVIAGSDQGRGSRQEVLMGQSGVVGRRLPALNVRTTTMAPGDLLVLATDGIHPDFARHIPRLSSPQHLADSIMAHHRTGADEALVLVVRLRGTPR